MSEQLPSHEKHEQASSPEKAEAEQHKVEQAPEPKSETIKPDLEAIHHKVEKEAKSAKEIKVDAGSSEKNDAEHYLVTKGLKQEAFKRSLQRARKHMSGSSRSFSKVIHQPVVDAVSKFGAKTIARPTGILTGAILALLGSSYLFYTAKHYGFQYNYLVVFMLLIGGYLIGLFIELFIYGVRRLRGSK